MRVLKILGLQVGWLLPIFGNQAKIHHIEGCAETAKKFAKFKTIWINQCKFSVNSKNYLKNSQLSIIGMINLLTATIRNGHLGCFQITTSY
jgi:hypothetical protein